MIHNPVSNKRIHLSLGIPTAPATSSSSATSVSTLRNQNTRNDRDRSSNICSNFHQTSIFSFHRAQVQAVKDILRHLSRLRTGQAAPLSSSWRPRTLPSAWLRSEPASPSDWRWPEPHLEKENTHTHKKKRCKDWRIGSQDRFQICLSVCLTIQRFADGQDSTDFGL